MIRIKKTFYVNNIGDIHTNAFQKDIIIDDKTKVRFFDFSISLKYQVLYYQKAETLKERALCRKKVQKVYKALMKQIKICNAKNESCCIDIEDIVKQVEGELNNGTKRT